MEATKMLRGYFKIILDHEYQENKYGLEKSIYTDEIIENETDNFIRHRKLNINKPCVINRNGNGWKLTHFDSLWEAIRSSVDDFDESYIAYDGCVMVPYQENEKITEQLIGVV